MKTIRFVIVAVLAVLAGCSSTPPKQFPENITVGSVLRERIKTMGDVTKFWQRATTEIHSVSPKTQVPTISEIDARLGIQADLDPPAWLTVGHQFLERAGVEACEANPQKGIHFTTLISGDDPITAALYADIVAVASLVHSGILGGSRASYFNAASHGVFKSEQTEDLRQRLKTAYEDSLSKVRKKDR